MFYKTLHVYMLRELLRIFVLTASALTVLMAFGGTFKPLTKEGLDVLQLLLVMLNAMPAMLAYAIPMAALFAAVLVYWRMSTDNEVVACRASGLSFFAVLMPAVLLGLAVAVTDFAFVNFVAPLFLQRTEQAIRRDLGSLLAYRISRQEPFQVGRLVVYADSAALTRASQENGADRSIVALTGMAATKLDRDGKPTVIITARKATVYFDETLRGDAAEVWVQLENGAAYDPANFRKVGGSVNRLPPENSKPYTIASQLRDKPKFLNIKQLKEMWDHPDFNSAVRQRLDNMEMAWQYQETAENLAAAFVPNQPMKLSETDDDVLVTAPASELTPEKTFVLHSAEGKKIRVDVMHHGRRNYYYTADQATYSFYIDDFPSPHVVGMLELQGKNVQRVDLIRNLTQNPTQTVVIQPLTLPAGVEAPHTAFDVPTIRALESRFTPQLQQMDAQTKYQVNVLKQYILSEMHSRVSFAVSCLTLVMLGAALGIQLRGRNPLAVFVVGFVPALVLVMLITAGRQMIESGHTAAVHAGYWIIWTGNGLILALVIGVYQKLLRE